jgi:hypothetical protein
MKTKKYTKAIYYCLLLLFSSFGFSQVSIVASGSSYYKPNSEIENESSITIGEFCPVIQSSIEEEDKTLSTPKFEIETPVVKPVIKPKKQSFLEILIDFLKKIFKKK